MVGTCDTASHIPTFFTPSTNQMILLASNAAALVLLYAYVTTLVTDRPRWEFAVASISCTALSFAFELHTRRIPAYLWDTGVPFPIVYALFSFKKEVQSAQACALLFFLWHRLHSSHGTHTHTHTQHREEIWSNTLCVRGPSLASTGACSRRGTLVSASRCVHTRATL